MKTRSKGKESLCGLMVGSMMEIGWMVSNMEKVTILARRGMSKELNGNWVNALNGFFDTLTYINYIKL